MKMIMLGAAVMVMVVVVTVGHAPCGCHGIGNRISSVYWYLVLRFPLFALIVKPAGAAHCKFRPLYRYVLPVL
ncbi:MAG: hypothetical protein IPL54_04750 [Chitinophagaceae bacterium]|nr:hypothetical protein [Chitinophagaceae bacterium]